MCLVVLFCGTVLFSVCVCVFCSFFVFVVVVAGIDFVDLSIVSIYFIMQYVRSFEMCVCLLHTCQPIQFTGIKYFHYFGGIWPYWKMDTGKHNFHEILLLF